MKTLIALSTVIGLALTASSFAQTAMRHHHTTRHTGVNSTDTTTPSVSRPTDADVHSANRKGGTGGKNSASNGS